MLLKAYVYMDIDLSLGAWEKECQELLNSSLGTVVYMKPYICFYSYCRLGHIYKAANVKINKYVLQMNPSLEFNPPAIKEFTCSECQVHFTFSAS